MLVLSQLFQGLIVSVRFACLVAPFCLIALEKSTSEMHLNVQLLPFLVQAVL